MSCVKDNLCCLHEKPDSASQVCCWCGNLYLPKPFGDHGEFKPPPPGATREEKAVLRAAGGLAKLLLDSDTDDFHRHFKRLTLAVARLKTARRKK